MPINIDSIKGYILEEVLAYLIRNTGYRLIVDSSEDPDDLRMSGGSLKVKGRGAEHQVDVLGQLKWIPAFTFPIRLFIEAKFRGGKIGLPIVRNAVGVILDINQKYKPIGSNSAPQLRYHYAYSLFSISGFSGPAQDMAFSHEISLIDLSGPEYLQLVSAIDNATTNLTTNNIRDGFVNDLRYVIRSELGTLPESADTRDHDNNRIRGLRVSLRPIFVTALNYNELFVGMANGPFMLLLKAQNPSHFLEYMRTNPRTRVTIFWRNNNEEGSVWIVKPVENPGAFQLEFRLPSKLEEWIFKIPSEARERALDAKNQYFSNITIYRRDETADRIFTLEYDRVSTQRQLEEISRR
jgi:hypothetical protein